MNATGRREETSLSDIAEGYLSFWVFVIPFVAAAIAKFTVLAMIALPGGASGFLPWQKKKVESEGPRPMPMREPEPVSERMRERLAAVGGGGGGRPKS